MSVHCLGSDLQRVLCNWGGSRHFSVNVHEKKSRHTTTSLHLKNDQVMICWEIEYQVRPKKQDSPQMSAYVTEKRVSAVPHHIFKNRQQH